MSGLLFVRDVTFYVNSSHVTVQVSSKERERETERAIAARWSGVVGKFFVICSVLYALVCF